MGQTLTHGIYLPDEGERNCYDGLAANWQLLDGAVGTVAEHTTQIAGKAPAVHTHTKSDITDFPAYGNAAGTICEGNDSRLSDARTPVAHTHTKSDVTDLLNSNFIPSANNSYDLGSSTYQWNNLYAKNYYYNGVAWGLDKANTWSDTQTFLTNPTIKNNGLEKGVSPTANSEKTIVFTDKNDNQISSLYARMNTNGESYVALRAENLYKNGAMDSTGDLIYSVVFIGMDSQGNPYCVPRADLYPDNTNRFNLGTSSKKWKTLNGINPGALSLPGKSFELINSQIYNPSDQLGAIDLNGGANYWTSDCDCYIYFFTKNDRFSWIQIYWPNTSVCLGQTYTPVPNETSDYSGFIPVAANTKVIIKIKGTQDPTFRRVPCQGNV